MRRIVPPVGLALCLFCAPGLVLADAADVADVAGGAVTVSGQRDALSIEARQAPLEEVLKAIARATGLRLHLEADAQGSPGNWSIRAQPLATVLRQVLGCRRWILMEAPTTGRGEPATAELLVLDCPSEAPSVVTTPCPSCAADLPGGGGVAVRTDPDPAGTLAEALRDDGPRAARGNIDAIEALAPDAAIRALERALGAPDAWVRIEVIGAIARIGTDAAVRAIAQAALGDPDPAVRKAALGTLATLGHPFVPHLMRSALKDPDKETRETAKTLLETVGDVGRESAQVDAPQGVPPAPVVPASASTTPRH